MNGLNIYKISIDETEKLLETTPSRCSTGDGNIPFDHAR